MLSAWLNLILFVLTCPTCDWHQTSASLAVLLCHQTQTAGTDWTTRLCSSRLVLLPFLVLVLFFFLLLIHLLVPFLLSSILFISLLILLSFPFLFPSTRITCISISTGTRSGSRTRFGHHGEEKGSLWITKQTGTGTSRFSLRAQVKFLDANNNK